MPWVSKGCFLLFLKAAFAIGVLADIALPVASFLAAVYFIGLLGAESQGKCFVPQFSSHKTELTLLHLMGRNTEKINTSGN